MSRKGTPLESLPVDNDYRGIRDNSSVNEKLAQLESKKHRISGLIPQDDAAVKRILERLEEPSELYSEDAVSRRERLTNLLTANKDYLRKFYRLDQTTKEAESIVNVKDRHIDGGENGEDEEEEEEEEFYTPASSDLISARKHFIKFSLLRSFKRIRSEKQRQTKVNIKREIRIRRNIIDKLGSLELSGAQVIASKPVSRVRFSPDNTAFATTSWDGDLKILNTETLEPVVADSSASRGKISGLDWSNDGKILISGAEDTFIRLYNYETETNTLEETATFKGHEMRVADTQFHPDNRYFASASFDTTWRLWDTETTKELLLQEGHAREVYTLSFQCDGSLLSSGGLDCSGVVWDIRSGKSVMVLKGHTKPVYAMDWSCNGYHVATGGGDGVVNIWDIRKTNLATDILAHRSSVMDIKFCAENDSFLITCGYDKEINVFSCGNWRKVATVGGNLDKLLSVDISNDTTRIIAAGWDRSVKLWRS